MPDRIGLTLLPEQIIILRQALWTERARLVELRRDYTVVDRLDEVLLDYLTNVVRVDGAPR